MAVLLNLIQIILIDLSMAGDNALVVGAAVAALPQDQRKRAMTAGIAVATLLRILMAFFAVDILQVTGLLAAGGLLMMWVGWKMLHDLRKRRPTLEPAHPKKVSAAIWQIIFADFSMSLDNVLGIAGIARGHRLELVVGLGLSVALMGLASHQVAKLTARFPNIGYIGAAIVFYTGIIMIHDGAEALMQPIHALV